MWADRDLDGAVGVLEAALADSPGPILDPWWFAVSRALAQIAMEVGALDRAERHLRRLPGSCVGDAQTVALRSRHLFLRGEGGSAAIEISIALGRLAADRTEDVGSLMNGAIALMWCAEVLVEIGYGQEATDLVIRARERVARAGVDDPLVAAVLAMTEAAAARLGGDPDQAATRLAAVDQAVSGELVVLVARERARLAWDQGDLVAAGIHYDHASAVCESMGYRSLVDRISAEREDGPPRPQTNPNPIEQWAARHTERLLADHRPYAVTVRLAVDANLGRFADLEEKVNARLAATPGLGVIDGTGSDGQFWELFLDGDDPDALWAAVRSLVEATGPTRGSEVAIRRDNQVENTPLSPT